MKKTTYIIYRINYENAERGALYIGKTTRTLEEALADNKLTKQLVGKLSITELARTDVKPHAENLVSHYTRHFYKTILQDEPVIIPAKKKATRKKKISGSIKPKELK